MNTINEIQEKSICLCGSIKFAPEMKRLAKTIQKSGKNALLPKSVIELEENIAVNESYDKAKRKREVDAIRIHFNKIAESDAILVCNYSKNNIENYIGANTFLEMGFAHCSKKKIYLINPLPNMPYINDELFAFDVEILDCES